MGKHFILVRFGPEALLPLECDIKRFLQPSLELSTIFLQFFVVVLVLGPNMSSIDPIFLLGVMLG